MNTLYRTSSTVTVSPEKAKKIIGPVFIGFGLFWLLIASLLIGKEKMFIKNAIETEGTVIGFETARSSKGRTQYRTQYTYYDADNVLHINTGSVASNPKEFNEGDKIKVYYSKSDYDSSIYKGKSGKFLNFLLGLFGIVFFIAGIVVSVAVRRSFEGVKTSSSDI